MPQYIMVIDLNRCIGCHSCAVACKAEHGVPAESERAWVRRLGPANTSSGLASTFYPGHCNHCDRPPCVPVCPVKAEAKIVNAPGFGLSKALEVAATWKDPFTGIVMIDRERCVGCGACVEACPYRARYLNRDLIAAKADKCDFCQARLAAGQEPACVQTCLGQARIFGDADDPKSKVAEVLQRGAIALESEAVAIGPNVRYLGSQKDLELLTVTSRPTEMPIISQRRTFLNLAVNTLVVEPFRAKKPLA